MRSTIFGLTLLSVLPFTAAHGFVRSLTIDGKKFNGNVPNGKTSDSVIRQINSVDPVKGATNKAINCGQNAKKAALVADANPGSTVEFDWAGGDGGNWPHNTGPMMTYLASCGNTMCDQFDSGGAKWFKIDEVGKKDGSATWFQQDLMNGKAASVKLPNNLAAGQYLVRHEVIGLHLAEQKGGAEFYPSCSQINVGGNGTGTPSSSELVSFPGAYKDTDPGILVDAFNADKYDFPGPKVATLASGNSSDSSSGSDSGSDSGSTKTTSGSDASETSTMRGKSSSDSNDNSSRTQANAASQTATDEEASSTASSSESTSTSTREGQSKQCGGGESTSATPIPTLSSGVSGESVLTSFAVTSTITLDSVATEAAPLSSTLPEVRPRHISRIMRRHLSRVH